MSMPGEVFAGHSGPGGVEVIRFAGGQVWARPADAASADGSAPSADGRPAIGETRVFGLSRGLRDWDFTPVAPAEVAARLLSGVGLDRLAAPFAAVAVTGEDVVAAVDQVGLRHLYVVEGDGWAALSTSALELAALVSAPLDRGALATFAATGFHIGHTTLHEGVRKIAGGTRVRLAKGGLEIAAYQRGDGRGDKTGFAGLAPADLVVAMADFLRGSVERCLDRDPDTVFELSGGFDSRLLFAAVPPGRRSGIRTLTLSTPGSADTTIAGEIAARYRTRHQVVDLSGLAALAPAAAHDLVIGAARRHDGVGNPVSLGVLDWAEALVAPGTRITGQAGEMCRGTFYLGQRQHDRPDDELVERLARWWFLTNEATSLAGLAPDFAAETRPTALAAIRSAFAGYDTDWLNAIDEFYLRERVHRWVGINFSGACLDRTIVSPYFDPRFLAISMAVPPSLRNGSGFAARVLERLDLDLAKVILATGVRPTHLPRRYVPAALAEYSVAKYVRLGTQKVLKLALRRTEAAAGTPALANLVVQHWRAQPELVRPVLRTGLISADWLAGLIAGDHGADGATVGFLSDLVVATGG